MGKALAHRVDFLVGIVNLSDKAFKARIELLPPSVNRMYVYTTRGPRPSGEMKKFKAKAASQIAKQVLFDRPPLSSEKPYRLVIDFYLPALYNSGWPKKAKTRFKRRDVSNLIKVVEDVVSACLGIDDSCFTEVHVRKLHGPKHNFEGLDISIYELSDEATRA